MRIVKKISVSGEFAKKGEDIKDGDVVKIIDAGNVTEGQFGTQHIFQIETRNGAKNLGFNQTSLNGLFDAYGDDTDEWVGKEAQITILDQVVAGKRAKVAYVGQPGAELDDNMRFVPKKN